MSCRRFLWELERRRSSHLLTSVDGMGSRGQDLTIAATRLLTRRCIFGGDDQRAFLNCMTRLLKLAKSVHILGMPVFFHPVWMVSPEGLGVEFKVHLIPEVITWIQISEAHRKKFARFVKTHVIPYQLRDFSIELKLIFLKCLFEFMINTAPPASNSVYSSEKLFWYDKKFINSCVSLWCSGQGVACTCR